MLLLILTQPLTKTNVTVWIRPFQLMKEKSVSFAMMSLWVVTFAKIPSTVLNAIMMVIFN